MVKTVIRDKEMEETTGIIKEGIRVMEIEGLEIHRIMIDLESRNNKALIGMDQKIERVST
jgi:hypothetical protein